MKATVLARLPIFFVVAALYGVGHPSTAWAWQFLPQTQELRVLPRPENLELSWSDAEDTVTGSLRPVSPSADRPIELTLKVGSFEGREFQGPVTVSLRRSDDRISDVRVLPFTGHGWATRFEVSEGGTYELDVAFQTTRHKTVRATFPVSSAAAVPRTVRWAVLATVGLIALAFGLRMVRRWPKVGSGTTST